MLILFLNVVSELLHIPHIDFHHNVTHHYTLSVTTAMRKTEFFPSFPLWNLSLFNAATIYIQFFPPDPVSMNILLTDSIYTFKRRYDNNVIIPKRYSYLPTPLPLTHKFFINSRQDHYLNMWLEHLLGLIHNYRVSIILCQRFFGNGRGEKKAPRE